MSNGMPTSGASYYALQARRRTEAAKAAAAEAKAGGGESATPVEADTRADAQKLVAHPRRRDR